MESNDRATAVVARTRDALEAQIWVDLLRNDGLKAAVYEQGVRGALGGASLTGSAHNIIVRRADFARARNIIAEADGAHALAPLTQDDESSARMIRALLTAGGVAVGFVLLLAIVQALA